MFNLLPGQGLGKETSHILAFGLGAWKVLVVRPYEIMCSFARSKTPTGTFIVKTLNRVFKHDS